MPKQVLLDTNFILSCVRNKIDFLEEILFTGCKILVPLQVIREVERLAKKKLEAKLALKMLHEEGTKKIDIGKGHVDKRIIKYAREHKDVIVGTLDREIKAKLKGRLMVIRGKKRLEVV